MLQQHENFSVELERITWAVDNLQFLRVTVTNGLQVSQFVIDAFEVGRFIECVYGLVEFEQDSSQFARYVRRISVDYSESGYIECVYDRELTIDYATITPMMNAYIPIRQNVILNRAELSEVYRKLCNLHFYNQVD